MERTVLVYGKPYTITVNQRSKSVWVATGAYMGETLQVQDRSEKTAMARWREAAAYKGNG